MILYLIRRDFAWKAAIGFSLGCALMFLVRPWSPGMAFTLSGIWVLGYILIFALRGERCTAFEAALPISGPQILAARLLSSALLVWLPVLILWVTSAFGHGLASDLLSLAIEAASILTVAQLTVQSLRIKEFAPPRWAAPTALCTVVLAFMLVVDRIAVSWVLLASALSSAVLLLRIWGTAPETFQAAPLNAASRHPKEDHHLVALPVWLPVWRAVFSKSTLILLLATVASGLAKSGWFVFGIVYVAMLFANGLSRTSWLLTLPLSRHKVFLHIVGPTLGLFLAANLLRMGWLRLEPRIVIANLTALAAPSLFGILAIELLFSRLRFRRPSRRLITVLVLLCGILWIWPVVQSGTRNLQLPLAQWMTQILPNSLALSFVAAAGFLGVLYWLSFMAFGLVEVTPPRRNLG